MKFNSQTLKHLQKLDKPEFDFLFEQMDTNPNSTEQKLLNEITEIAFQELGLPEQELEKLGFFIRLGYFSRALNGELVQEHRKEFISENGEY